MTGRSPEKGDVVARVALAITAIAIFFLLLQVALGSVISDWFEASNGNGIIPLP